MCSQSSICSVPSQYLTHLEVMCVGKNETASRQQRQQANWEPLGVEGTSIAFGLVFYVTVCKANKGRAVWRLSTFNPWRFRMFVLGGGHPFPFHKGSGPFAHALIDGITVGI